MRTRNEISDFAPSHRHSLCKTLSFSFLLFDLGRAVKMIFFSPPHVVVILASLVRSSNGLMLLLQRLFIGVKHFLPLSLSPAGREETLENWVLECIEGERKMLL